MSFDALTEVLMRMMNNDFDKKRIQELVALSEIVAIDYNIMNSVSEDGTIKTKGKDVLLFPNTRLSKYYWGAGREQTNYKIINHKKQEPYIY